MAVCTQKKQTQFYLAPSTAVGLKKQSQFDIFWRFSTKYDQQIEKIRFGVPTDYPDEAFFRYAISGLVSVLNLPTPRPRTVSLPTRVLVSDLTGKPTFANILRT